MLRRWQTKYRFIAVAVFWFAWRSAPGIISCAGYWIAIFSVLEIAFRSRKLAKVESSLLFLGVLSNALVTMANGGIMPAVGMPSSFIPASGIWSGSDAGSRWLLLADNARLYYFSLGDIFLYLGIILFVVRNLTKLIQRRLYHAETMEG